MLHEIIAIILLVVIVTAALAVLYWTYWKRYKMPPKQIRMKPGTLDKTIAGLLEMRGEMKTPNILLCGQSGAGKSSAVNFLFRDDIAAVSNAEPCSEDIQFYAGTDINFYDSEGYEIGSSNQEHYCQLLFESFLNKPENQKDDGVHLIWYTISAAGKRYTSLDIQLIKRIAAANYKISILVTKIDALSTENLTRFCSALRRDLPDIPVFRISTVAKEIVQKHCDWQKLIRWSYSSLPEIYQGRFLAGLRAGLEEKRLSAENAVKMAALAAGGVGASPIPFSDAALILPIQTAMVARIMYIYGINLPNGTAASLLGGVGIQSLGRYIAGNLLKLIPGLGDIAGGMINASIAAALTFAIGEALTSLCHNRCVQTIGSGCIDIDIEQELADPSFLDSLKQLLSSSTLRDRVQTILNKPQ